MRIVHVMIVIGNIYILRCTRVLSIILIMRVMVYICSACMIGASRVVSELLSHRYRVWHKCDTHSTSAYMYNMHCMQYAYDKDHTNCEDHAYHAYHMWLEPLQVLYIYTVVRPYSRYAYVVCVCYACYMCHTHVIYVFCATRIVDVSMV